MSSISNFPPIKIHPDNPHYYLFRDQPTMLITSAEHYGAVINHGFNYVKYLDTLQTYRLNYTRIYPGALIEREGDFIGDNTLAPKPDQLLLPWARSSEAGYALGGNKFDLSRWDERFFARLEAFISEASKRNIVVEICFFNCQYPNNWDIQAFHPSNNVQNLAKLEHNAFQTLQDPVLVEKQVTFMTEIITRVNRFDNVIFEICDEPGQNGTPAQDYHAWISYLIDQVLECQATLPNKHLIAQQVQGDPNSCGDFSADPRVSIIVGQYPWHDDGKQIGGLQMLETKYHLNKPIELNETAYYPVWYTEDREAASRVEAWEFMIGGGASFNQLNGMYTIFNPTGQDPNNHKVLSALSHLQDFLSGFSFIKMQRDVTSIQGGIPTGAKAQCLSEIGQQYAFYIHHSIHRINRYITRPGVYQDRIVFELPYGQYNLEWYSPEFGTLIATETLKHFGGNTVLETPPYRTDIALKITRRM